MQAASAKRLALPHPLAAGVAILLLGLATAAAAVPFPAHTALAVLGASLLLLFWLKLPVIYSVTLLAFQTIVVSLAWTEGTVKFTLKPYDILCILCLFSFFTARAMNRVKPYAAKPGDLLAFCLFALGVASLWWSHDVDRGVYELLRLSGALFFALVLTPAVIDSERRLNLLMHLLIIAGVVNGAISIFAFYTYPDFLSQVLYKDQTYTISLLFNDLTVQQRGHGFTHPLNTSIWLDMALFMVAAKFVTMPASPQLLRGRAGIAITGLFILASHLSTMSKGSVLSMLAVAGLIILAVRHLRLRLFQSAAVVALALVCCFLAVHSVDLVKHIKVIGQQTQVGGERSSANDRVVWWGQALDKTMETDGAGVGAGGIFQYLDPWGPHAHSIYLSTLSELGFPGLILFLLVCIVSLVHFCSVMRRCKNTTNQLLLLMFTANWVNMLVYGFLDLTYSEATVWAPLGMAHAACILVMRAEAAGRSLFPKAATQETGRAL